MSRKRRSRGYNLVAVVMMVAVMNILVAAALPLWSTAIQREREEELISRGLQYAEAIRVFQRRFGRLPNRLQELLEVKPRSIRQLWADPVSGSRKWRLILEGTGSPLPGQPLPPGTIPSGSGMPGGFGADPTPTPPEPLGGGEDEGEEPPPLGTAPVPTGPIRGVKSRSDESAHKLFFGKSRYGEWEFKVDLLLAPPLGMPGQPSPRLNATLIGRPFRFPPPAGAGGMPQIPGGTGPGGIAPPQQAPPVPTPLPGVGLGRGKGGG